MLEITTDTLLFLLLSVAGWRVFLLLKLPAPEILGAMAFVASGNLLGLDVSVNSGVNTLITVGVGIIVGTQFNVRLNLRLAREVLLVCVWLIGTGLLISRILILMGVEAGTALFASLPGGIAEMAFISLSFKADPFQVTLMHAARMISLLIVMPFLIRRLPKSPKAPETASFDGRRAAGRADWIKIVALSALAGLGLDRLGVPAGAFIGALVATGLFAKIGNIKPKMHTTVKSILESCVGGVVGTKVVRESLAAVPSLIWPVIVLTVLVMLSSLVLGRVLYKVSDMDRASAQLASVPGGFSAFVALADKLNADVGRVAVFHLCRYLSMILFSVIQGVINMQK